MADEEQLKPVTQKASSPKPQHIKPVLGNASSGGFQNKTSETTLTQQPEEDEEEESEKEHNVCANLLEDDAFHGMLPIEDLNQLLKQNGNYLIRSAKTDKGSRMILVSVFWNGQVKHAEVREAPNNNVTFDLMNVKPTVLELIEFHRSGMVPISLEGVILGKAIKRQSWELRRDAIKKTSKIGEGAFGEVYRGTLKLKTTGQILKVAIKIPKVKDLNKDLVGEAMKEARIQKDYVHPNIVQLYGVSAEIEPLMIVLEYINGGSLENYLKKHKDSLTPEHKAMMCFDVASGLEFLHSRDCIHRDIAARNCLVCTKVGIVKISDFGLSSVGTVHVMDRNKPAPIRWLAPDVLKTATYVKASDIWSLGIVFWEIYTNCAEVPFKNYTTSELQLKLRTEAEFHPEMPLITLYDVQNLALKCWNMDPEKRPTAEQCTTELFRHAYRERIKKIPGYNIELVQTVSSPTKVKKKKKRKASKKRSKTATTQTSIDTLPVSSLYTSVVKPMSIESPNYYSKGRKSMSSMTSVSSKSRTGSIEAISGRSCEAISGRSREAFSSRRSAVSKKSKEPMKSKNSTERLSLQVYRKWKPKANSNKSDKT